MKQVKIIVFRYLTDADFFNMYKPSRTEVGGGGQLYIDFKTSSISVSQWDTFFSGVTDVHQRRVRNGPEWEFPVHSIGCEPVRRTQRLRIYQRRAASICIPNQNINTRSANRAEAWQPSNGFPQPQDPTNRQTLPSGLVVYLVRTYENEVWAGYFINQESFSHPYQNDEAMHLIENILRPDHEPGDVGFLTFAPDTLCIDEANIASPFCTNVSLPHRELVIPSQSESTVSIKRNLSGQRRHSATIRTVRQRRQRSEEEILDSLFKEDDDCADNDNAQIRETYIRVRQRNQNSVRDLKELYEHKCQITGNQFTFLKRDGIPYTEAHHLLPLGSGGADNPRNMIIVSPLLHRMLHYASVEGIDLSHIQEQPDDSAFLEITINGRPYTIRWKSQHAERVLRHQNESS
jgi:5-methylcytosine-specific restriction protein A